MGKALLAALLATTSFAASAQWYTTVEDDVFSSGKKATMFATINDDINQAIAFECTKDSLSFAYIEKSPEMGKVKAFVDTVVKVDSGDVIRFQTQTGPRNADYSEASTDDREPIINILKQSAFAKKKLLIGFSVPATDVKQSFTVNISGSSAAVKKFTTACEIAY